MSTAVVNGESSREESYSNRDEHERDIHTNFKVLTQADLTQLLVEIGPDNVKALFHFTRQIERHAGLTDPERNVTRDDEGRPYLIKGTPTKLIYATDCYDTETRVRLLAWMNKLDQYLVHNSGGSVLPTESLNQEHLATVFTSFYYERRSLEGGNHPDPDPVIFLANAAPRPADNAKGVGTKFVFAELEGGVYYIGTFGPELSRVKKHIQCLYEVDIEHQNAKTSFRSRFLPEVAKRWLDQDRDIFVAEIPLSQIPEPQKDILASVDNFGNMKLGFSEGDNEYKSLLGVQKALVTLNGVTKEAKIGATLGDAKEGELILTVGTSRTGVGEEDYGIVIYSQNQRAIDKFTGEDGETPPVGSKIKIELVH